MARIFLITFLACMIISGCTTKQEEVSHGRMLERHANGEHYTIERTSNGVFIYKDNVKDDDYTIN